MAPLRKIPASFMNVLTGHCTHTVWTHCTIFGIVRAKEEVVGLFAQTLLHFIFSMLTWIAIIVLFCFFEHRDSILAAQARLLITLHIVCLISILQVCLVSCQNALCRTRTSYGRRIAIS